MKKPPPRPASARQPPKKDRRFQRTEEALTRALIDLALEQDYAAITIRQLTERAGIGYATFFRHFPDKDALLRNVLDVFVAELLALFQDGAAARAPGSGALLFRYLQAHHELCRVLLTSPGSGPLVRQMVKTLVAHTLAHNAPRPGSPVPPEIAAHHVVTASIALIRWWLDHDMPYPPERMGAIYEALVIGPAQAVAFTD